jgi:hypothetical protein
MGGHNLNSHEKSNLSPEVVTKTRELMAGRYCGTEEP